METGLSSPRSVPIPPRRASLSGMDEKYTHDTSPGYIRRAFSVSEETPESAEGHGNVGLNLGALGRSLRSVTSTGSSIAGPLGGPIANTLDLLAAAGLGRSVETYYCQICFENRPMDFTFRISECGHNFCQDCLKAYVTSKVNDGQVNPLCFHMGTGNGSRSVVSSRDDGDDHPCGAHIGEVDIESLLDAPVLEKYHRFKFSRENEHARECPRCECQQVGDPLLPQMVCQSCGTTYCYTHGGAHQGKSCAEHERATAEEMKLNQALISNITKPCPGCKTPIEKTGGCNQMTCYHCGTSFCWICGQQVDSGTFPVHFQWWNVAGCPNQQLQDSVETPSSCARAFMRLVSAIQLIIIGPVALALTVASSTACCCLLPCFGQPPAQLFSGCFSFWGNVVVFLILSPLAFAFILVMLLIYLIFLPLKFFSTSNKEHPAEGGDSLEGVLPQSPLHSSCASVLFDPESGSAGANARAWGNGGTAAMAKAGAGAGAQAWVETTSTKVSEDGVQGREEGGAGQGKRVGPSVDEGEMMDGSRVPPPPLPEAKDAAVSAV
ncbi:unnamed protein product [Discosporangium mesarthrocarpum]